MNAQGNGNDAVRQTFNRSKNTVYQGYQKFTALSVLSQIFTVILAILLFGLVIYLVYYFYNVSQYGTASAPMFIDKPVNAFDENLSRTTRQIPTGSQGLSFTYNFWMYIADWQYRFNEKKTIFIKGNNSNRAPEVYLAPSQNSLGVTISTFAEPDGESCNIDNIPLQKWVNVAVVLNNRTVDIYVDGKLERSCVLRGVPRLNRNDIRFAPDGGFYGQLAKFRYFNRPITPDEVFSIYSNGPY